MLVGRHRAGQATLAKLANDIGRNGRRGARQATLAINSR